MIFAIVFTNFQTCITPRIALKPVLPDGGIGAEEAQSPEVAHEALKKAWHDNRITCGCVDLFGSVNGQFGMLPLLELPVIDAVIFLENEIKRDFFG